MPKVLKSHGERILDDPAPLNPLSDNTIYKSQVSVKSDEEGNLVPEVEVVPVEIDHNITADDLSLSNVILSGSIGMLKPIRPIAPSSLSAIDSLSTGLSNLDQSNIIQPKTE